jgi:cell wall-associated NlpC family hydrolase
MWRIRQEHDDYEGWVDARQFTALQPQTPPTACILTADIAGWAERRLDDQTERRLLPLGTPLPGYAGGRFWIGAESWLWTGAIHHLPAVPHWDHLLQAAEPLQQAPYFWGGRTLWGIDCSGLVQSLLGHQGVRISRDCITQVEEGKEVPRLAAALPGDLAFFDGTRDGGRHVGLVLGGGRVLHASGFVRTDLLTDRGIVVPETGHLSHHLRSLRRVTDWQRFGS